MRVLADLDEAERSVTADVAPRGRVTVNTSVSADLDAGRLVPVLEEYNPREVAPIHAVYLGRPDRLP